MSAPREVLTAPDHDGLAALTAARLVVSLADAQSRRGSASVVLTGGGIGIATLTALAATASRVAVDWPSVDVWWGDERFVPAGDGDRNDGQAMAAFGDAIRLDPARVHRMGSSDAYPDPDAAATAYAAELIAAAPAGAAVPTFDVLLLGMGPEGHTASIFPHSPAATDGRTAFAVRDCPKPPPTRVSMGFGAITAAREVWLIVSGHAKADAVARMVAGADRTDLPAAGALGTERSLLLADHAALRR